MLHAAAYVACCRYREAPHLVALHCHVLQVWTWGEPWGDFSMKVDRSPKSVAGATDIVKIACGAFHNLCLNA